jgi:hypothetical protein
MRKVHAGIYAMGSIQTALLNGGDITKPLSLLGKAASRNLIADNYLGSSQQDLASKLLEDSALMDTDALLGVKMI